MKIGNREVSKESPCFIIAEAGANFRISSNQEKNYAHALKLIDIAVEAKADAVKFQLYRSEKLYSKSAGSAEYIGKTKSISQIIKELELPYEWLQNLKKYCDEKKILFLCTPFDEESVEQLEKINISAYKIASYTISHIPLLRYIAKKGKPMILSTGASNFDDIDKAIEVIKREGNNNIIILQCTAKYPAPLSTLNLKVLVSLQEKYPYLVGLSDHSREPFIGPMGAVTLGAKVIEKHFTTDNSLDGPDHGFAILSHELIELVSNIRKLEQALGSNQKVVLNEEKELHHFARRCIYASKNISKGEIFSKDNLVILRSGNDEKGLEPFRYDDLIDKKATLNMEKDTIITEVCFE